MREPFEIHDSENGRLIARTLVGGTFDPDMGVVQSVVVHPHYRNKGYGTQLMQMVCDWADENGKDLRLTVAPLVRPMFEGRQLDPSPMLTKEQLFVFYGKFGFVLIESTLMIRTHASRKIPVESVEIFGYPA